jgi:hypothetical protein
MPGGVASLLAQAIPDYVGPIEAWRVWRVVLRNGEIVLESVFARTTWEPGVALAASCATGRRSPWRPWRLQPNDHLAPELDCTCGVYGLAEEAAAREYLDADRFVSRGNRVLGRVALWGEVVVCENGWRASRAYPVELLVPVPVAEGGRLRRRGYLDEIALGLEAYGVPVDFAPALGVGVLG